MSVTFLLLFAIVEIFAITVCAALVALVVVRRLRRSLRQIHHRLAELDQRQFSAQQCLDAIADFQTKRWAREIKEQGMRPLRLETIVSKLAATFSVETGYRPVEGQVVMANERLMTGVVAASEIVSRLGTTNPLDNAAAVSGPAEMVVAWESLRHAFHTRAALDMLCRYVRPRGRLIYAQALTDPYLGLTPKWLLDYFIAAGYSDCRVYLLWAPDDAPAVATFDYQWMLENARPVYNPMWDNITHAEGVVVVAEKAADCLAEVPSQDIYRPADEWQRLRRETPPTSGCAAALAPRRSEARETASRLSSRGLGIIVWLRSMHAEGVPYGFGILHARRRHSRTLPSRDHRVRRADRTPDNGIDRSRNEEAI